MSEKFNTDMGKEPKSGFLAWLDNFWYHYKWHSIISLFLVFTISVCTLQMCSKESYDIHILYAGSHAFSRQSVDGDVPEYYKTKSTVSRFASDFDGNGEVNVSLRDLFLPTTEQMKDLGESEYQRAYEDRTNITTIMASSDYFLMFLSPEVYESYKDERRFMNIAVLCPELPESAFYGEGGMALKLSSLDASDVSGLSSLPSDTVICLRSTNFSSHLNKKSNKEAYERAEKTLLKLIEYSAQ